MDPDRSLEEARRAVRDYYDALTDGDRREAERAAQVLADRFSALDEWMSHDGFLPREWLTHNGCRVGR